MGRSQRFYDVQDRVIRRAELPTFTLEVDKLTFTPDMRRKTKPAPRSVKMWARKLLKMTHLGRRASTELQLLHRHPQMACDVMLEIARIEEQDARKVAKQKYLAKFGKVIGPKRLQKRSFKRSQKRSGVLEVMKGFWSPKKAAILQSCVDRQKASPLSSEETD